MKMTELLLLYVYPFTVSASLGLHKQSPTDQTAVLYADVSLLLTHDKVPFHLPSV